MDAIAGIVMIIILVSVLGMMTGSLIGRKLSPFWLVRPIVSKLSRSLASMLRNCSGKLSGWGKQLIRRRPIDTSWFLLNLPTAILVGLVGLTIDISLVFLPQKGK